MHVGGWMHTHMCEPLMLTIGTVSVQERARVQELRKRLPRLRTLSPPVPRMHVCTHARMHACTYARMHVPPHALAICTTYACAMHARMYACAMHARTYACPV